jgi:hypothetical protein
MSNKKKTPTITVGARVAWSSQAKGSERTKIGKIVGVETDTKTQEVTGVMVEVYASYAGHGPATSGTKLVRHKKQPVYRPRIAALREPNAKELLEVVS